jgi:hypothetical protein
MPLPPIRVPSEGDRRPFGVAHITLTVTAILCSYRVVPDWVPVPLVTVAVLPVRAPVTVGLFLTVHPQTTALIHTPNLNSLLPEASLNPRY